MKRLAFRLLIALCIYGFFAVGIPYFITLTSPNDFEGKQLIGVQSFGRFTYGQFSTIHYRLWENGETVSEMNSMSFFLSKNIVVRTERQKGGVYTIKWIIIGDQTYEKTLCDHPEILAEAERVLQLGRDNFAKAEKKLEQKSKRNQPARLG